MPLQPVKDSSGKEVFKTSGGDQNAHNSSFQSYINSAPSGLKTAVNGYVSNAEAATEAAASAQAGV